LSVYPNVYSLVSRVEVSVSAIVLAVFLRTFFITYSLQNRHLYIRYFQLSLMRITIKIGGQTRP
jgi:hypothetical protein